MTETATSAARSDLDTLVARHRAGIAGHDPSLGKRPRFWTVVLTCADARTDPAHFLGLEPGDAIVLRTLGGRVTDGVEEELALLSALARRMAPDAPPVHLVLVHHTDCGMQSIASPEAVAMVSEATGIAVDALRHRAIHDHEQSLADDLERLRRSPLVPNALIVSAHLHDLASGELREVVAPRGRGR